MHRRSYRCERLLFTLILCGLAQLAAAASPRVVVSIAPLHSLVAAVMAGAGEPHLLLRGGESPHSFSLRPSEARLIHDADVFFWIGPPLETPLARVLPNLGVSRAVAMLDSPGLQILQGRKLVAATDADPPAGHDHSHAGDGSGIDPHIWLSPANAGLMAARIAQLLARADPSRAQTYQLNARMLQDRLLQLDGDLKRQFAAVRGRYIVFHDAYHYLEDAYGLHPLASVTTHAERKPGAAHLRRIRALLEHHEVRCLFSEQQYQPRVVAMLGEGLPVRHAVLDPLGTGIHPGPEAYIQMMRELAANLTNCMRGAP